MSAYSITFAAKKGQLPQATSLTFATDDQVRAFAAAYFSKNYAVSPWIRNLVPAETQGGKKAFFRSLFVPNLTTVNQRVKALAARIFLWPLALIVDRLTLPIRLLTAIPWAIWSKRRDPHPFVAYCQANGHKQILERGKVHVVVKTPQSTKTHTVALRALAK